MTGGASFQEQSERFHRDIAALIGSDHRAWRNVGVAVSGGADSLALLLLANDALGSIRAATVDHGLRPEAAEEARFVGSVCARLAVPHETLTIDSEQSWSGPRGNQNDARTARYAALVRWCDRHDIAWLLTAHHAEDQAETVLMRLARGSGVGGLAGIRPRRPLDIFSRPDGPQEDGSLMVSALRPLLGWRREELAEIVWNAGLRPVVDPSNSDIRYDRTAARATLRQAGWIDAVRVARAAANLLVAEEALQWLSDDLAATRITRSGGNVQFDPAGLPGEVVRRLLLEVFRHFGQYPDGPGLEQLTATLVSAGTATLGTVKCRGGRKWHFTVAPPRRGT